MSQCLSPDQWPFIHTTSSSACTQRCASPRCQSIPCIQCAARILVRSLSHPTSLSAATHSFKHRSSSCLHCHLKIVSILLPPIKNVPARQHKYISSYVRQVLGPFRRGSLHMICCSNQHAYFWKKTPPKIFQNLSWVSLFFIFDLKNVNISPDIFYIL